MTLVTLAEKQYDWSLFSNGFGKNAIQERIEAIMKFKKSSIVSIVCAVALAGIAVTAFARDGSESAVQGSSNAAYNGSVSEKDSTKQLDRNDKEISDENLTGKSDEESATEKLEEKDAASTLDAMIKNPKQNREYGYPTKIYIYNR